MTFRIALALAIGFAAGAWMQAAYLSWRLAPEQPAKQVSERRIGIDT